MISKIEKGEPIDIETFIRLSDDPVFAYNANEMKKKVKREAPKVYRNGTGKRTKLIKFLHEADCDIQSDHEDKILDELSIT